MLYFVVDAVILTLIDKSSQIYGFCSKVQEFAVVGQLCEYSKSRDGHKNIFSPSYYPQKFFILWTKPSLEWLCKKGQLN